MYESRLITKDFLKAYESHSSLSKDPLDVPGEEILQTKEKLKFIENISAEEQLEYFCSNSNMRFERWM